MTIAQNAVLSAITSYCFNAIWNEPQLEYAENILLSPVGPRFMINWIIDNKYIPLPANGVQYAVYQTSYTNLEGSVIIPANTWFSSDVVGSQYQTLFHMYVGNGQMLPKKSVFMYYNNYQNRLYIAIVKAPFLAIVGVTDWSEIYLSVYRYTQAGNQITIQSFYIPSPDVGSVVTGQVNEAITASLAITTPGTTVYVNGYDMPTSGPITLAIGDYVDILTDTTVVGVYSVNLTTTNTGYMSTKYGVYKQVLHCPKALNPNNQIITTELLSITARRNVDNVGLYVTKAETNSVTQITHNDVGISTTVVDGMRTTLGTQDISIEVKIRSHQKTLIREVDYISYLYICDDADILNFLIGAGNATLPFWKAAALEQCTYVEYMSASSSFMSTQTLTSYIQNLGYYTVLSILCQHLNTYPVNSLPMNNLSVPKPLILSGLPAYPIAYINGTKVRDTQLGYSNMSSNNLLIGFTSDVYYTTGNTISVDIIEAGANVPYIFTPSSGTPTLTVPFSNVQVFKLNTLSTPVTGYASSSSFSCTPEPVTTNGTIQSYVSGTGTEVVFTSAAYGNTYLIQNATFSRCFAFDITAQVIALQPLNVLLTTICSDGTTTVPFTGYNSLDVYLNGRRLIPKIDYSANPFLDTSGNVALVQVMICNMKFVSLTGDNYVEVIARTGITVESESGYMANNLANIENSVEFWYTGMSEIFSNGQLQIGPTDAGNSLSPNPSQPNGIPFYLITELPDIIESVLTGYSSSVDDERITLINAYFNNLTPENNISTLIIPQSWTLYSPYLTAIYNAVTAAGQVQLFTNDPDNTSFLAQFSAYNYLLANDPTVNPTISNVDLRFCDVNPCYGTITVPNTTTYAILTRLEVLMLAHDTDTLGDVVDD